MTFNDWYAFNTQKNCTGHCMTNIGAAFVKITKNNSYKKEDVMLTTYMDMEDISNLFGNYELILFSIDKNQGISTLSFLLSFNRKA